MAVWITDWLLRIHTAAGADAKAVHFRFSGLFFHGENSMVSWIEAVVISALLICIILWRRRMIREKARLLKHITDNIPGVVYQFTATADRRYRNRFISEKVGDIFGLKSDPDHFFDAFIARIPKEDRNRFQTSVAEAIEKVAPWQYEGRFIKPDGDIIWFSGSSVPHREGADVVFDGVLLDITERVRAEQSRTAANRMLKLVLDTIPDRVFWKDADGRFLGCNRAFAQDAGLEGPESLIGKTDADMGWHDQAEQYRADDLAVMASGAPRIAYEEPQTTPGGGRIWLQTCKVPLRDESGAVMGILGTYQNITALKQAREESLKRQQFLESVLYHAPDAIATLDPDHRVVDWNPAAEAIFGYACDETLGRNLDDLVARGEVVDEAGNKTRQVLAGHRLEAFETVRYRKDGSPVNVIAAASPILVDDKLAGVVAVYTDITPLKKVEASLRRSEERLRKLSGYLANIIDSMPSVLVSVDGSGRVTQWNRHAERETGIRAAEATGRPFEEVFPCISEEMRRLRSAIGDRDIRRDTNVSRRRGGEIRYEDVTVYPLIANGVEGAVIRVDDVTERVRLEEVMIQSEKMLSVGGLAAGMAHEINNPLAGMIQTTLVMTDRLTGDLPANDRAAAAAGTTMAAIREFMAARGIPRMLETIRESGRRAADIVENMLSFARKSDAAASTHDIAGLLDRALQLAATDYNLKKRYDFRNIAIEKHYAENLPPVPCESGKIQQVFLNILRNGAEAMHANRAGRPPKFILRTMLEGDNIRIDMEDNGPGMPEAVRKRVFEPFFTTKPVGLGTGLGLSVSYFIVRENHGGDMAVSSTPGEGARFTIRLPLKRHSP